jgi:hypothetical protein
MSYISLRQKIAGKAEAKKVTGLNFEEINVASPVYLDNDGVKKNISHRVSTSKINYRKNKGLMKLGRRWIKETSLGLGDHSYSVISEMDRMIDSLGEKSGNLHKIIPGPIRWLEANFSESDLKTWGGANGLFNLAVNKSLIQKREYFKNSFGGLDLGIPKFLPNFLVEIAFPFAKRCFLMAIDRAGGSEVYDEMMSQSWEATLGSKNMWGVLDAGEEFFFKFFKNLFHEFHHNIVNPGAWKRFLKLGPVNSGNNYNFLDVLDEAISLFSGAYEENKKFPYEKLEDDFLSNLAEDIISQIVLLIKSSKTKDFINSFDEIISSLESSGGSHVDSDKKISFLRSALYDYLDNIRAYDGDFLLTPRLLKKSLKAEWDRSEIDFVVGKDEDILIAFSEVLDENIDDLKASFIQEIKVWGSDLSLEIVGYIQEILKYV